MKSLLLAAALASVAVLPAIAEDSATSDRPRHERGEFREKARGEMKEMRGEFRADRKEFHEKGREEGKQLHEEFRSRMEAAKTDAERDAVKRDFRAKADAMRKERFDERTKMIDEHRAEMDAKEKEFRAKREEFKKEHAEHREERREERREHGRPGDVAPDTK